MDETREYKLIKPSPRLTINTGKIVSNEAEKPTDSITVEKKGDIFIYTWPEIGTFTLISISFRNQLVLQVNSIEILENKQGKGFAAKFYRYVLENLPSGIGGILSGTITNPLVHKIYQKLGEEFTVEEISANEYQKLPTMYFVTPKE